MADCDAPVGAIFQVDVMGRWSSAADVINSFQLQYVDGPTVDRETLWTDIGDWAYELYDIVKDICNVLMVVDHYRVAHLNGNCSSGTLELASSIPGALTNDAYASGVAALTLYRTGIKRVVMRKYWGGLDESMVNEGGGMSATALGVLAVVNDFLIDPFVIDTRTYQYGYFSPKTAQFQVPINATRAAYPAYQRRRRVGSGS